jgi:hypothetical protein
MLYDKRKLYISEIFEILQAPTDINEITIENNNAHLQMSQVFSN